MIVAKGRRSFLVRLEPGDEVITSFKKFAKKWKIDGAILVSGIGMIERVKLGFFRKNIGYEEHYFDEPVELVSLSGNISRKEDGDVVVHLHAAIANEKSKVFGGHLIEAITAVTVEGFIIEPRRLSLVRLEDPETGLLGLYPSGEKKRRKEKAGDYESEVMGQKVSTGSEGLEIPAIAEASVESAGPVTQEVSDEPAEETAGETGGRTKKKKKSQDNGEKSSSAVKQKKSTGRKARVRK